MNTVDEVIAWAAGVLADHEEQDGRCKACGEQWLPGWPCQARRIAGKALVELHRLRPKQGTAGTPAS